VVTLFLGAAAAAVAPATTIRVPEDYPTVLAAGDAAAPGDTIFVDPGVWTETETRIISYCNGPNTFSANVFLRPGVALIGSGKTATIIEHGTDDAGTRQCVVISSETATEETRIENLSLRGNSSTSPDYS
jgi:hypothetical protein